MSGTQRVNKKWMAVGAAAIVVVFGGVAVWALALRADELPATTETDLVKLANFVRTDAFRELPEAQKRPYMKTLRKNTDELAEAAQSGRISQRDYEEAYLNAYFERKLDQMEEFYGLPADRRLATFTAEYVKKNQEKPKPAATAPAGKPGPLKPDEEVEDDWVDDRVATWPAEEQTKWAEYRRVLKQAKTAAAKR